MSEIEELRAELERVTEERGLYRSQNIRQEALIARLRGALERIANWRCTHAVDPIHELAMQNVARTALEPTASNDTQEGT